MQVSVTSPAVKDREFGAPSHESLAQFNLRNCAKREVRAYFENAYNLEELIFKGLKDDNYFYKCPDRLRLPLIFYLAHTASVYVNKLLLAGVIKERVNPEFEMLFETGVDENSWDDTENYRMGGAYKWPSVGEVMEYRKQVRELVISLIETMPFPPPFTDEHPLWALFLGIEHQRIHMETSSVLLRQLPVGYLQQPEGWKYGPPSAPTPPGANELIRVPPGSVIIGRPRDFPFYGWDNEYGRADIDVPEFEASKYLVTNGEFLEFVMDGGYQCKELWTNEGWLWVQYRQASHPTFWVCGEGCKSGCGADLAAHSHCKEAGNIEITGSLGGKYKYRALYDVIAMPWDWPVDVNYHEAKAYCSWRGEGFRMPSEAEHHRMRGDKAPSADPDCDPGFNREYPGNFHFKYGSSTPVNLYPPSPLGFHDMYGNVWEWVEDHFNGLPGFKTHFLYEDYSTPSFDGIHTMIMGGSWISTGCMASRFARNTFRRHFFQHVGFRVVRSTNPTPARMCKAEVFLLEGGVADNPLSTPNLDLCKCTYDSLNTQFQYETKEKLHSILIQEFETEACDQLVTHVEEMLTKYNVNKGSAINFCCGAGRTAFLLSRSCNKVVGVDFSGRFVDTALRLSEGKEVCYISNGVDKVATVPVGVDTRKVVFKQLTWVPNELTGFDVAVVEFLERLTEPKGWLCKLWECVVPGGVAVIATSPGGKWDIQPLQTVLGKWFALLEEGGLGDGGRSVSVWRLRE